MNKKIFSIMLAALLAVSLTACVKGTENKTTDTNSDTSSRVTSEDTTPSTPSPEEIAKQEEELAKQKWDEVIAIASLNCTKDAPQVTDPAIWNQNGYEIMHGLSAKFGTSIKEQPGWKYWICVNRRASTVTVYTLDDEGNYTVPYMAFVCSGGTDTPIRYAETPINYTWRLLAGPSYGQYSTRIWDAYLFHSVPYYSQHKDDIEYDEYNKLGTLASLGCIRLEVVDVKWIYDNCPIGTPVFIYDDAQNPGPMGKPGTIYTDPENEELRGWDPTDPDPANPWDDKYLTGTAIRSDAAWEEYNNAQLDGRWNGTISPTDLQGWSTDSKKEGTRG